MKTALLRKADNKEITADETVARSERRAFCRECGNQVRPHRKGKSGIPAAQRVEELERSLKFQQALTFKPPFYYLADDPNPYCPACWDSKRTAIHLHRDRQRLPVGDGMTCPVCKHFYRTSSAGV